MVYINVARWLLLSVILLLLFVSRESVASVRESVAFVRESVASVRESVASVREPVAFVLFCGGPVGFCSCLLSVASLRESLGT